ncbi:TetR/AcrR family transcriptional regulator [Geodermatophilus sp. URMC 64]
MVHSAMELFASQRSDAITVAEIAEAAGMTSAAVYYHFASKDDILLEGLRSLGEALVTEARRAQQDIAARGASIGELPVRLIQWMDERRAESTVWFVKSAGVSLAVEQLRREVRGDLITVFTRAAKTARDRISTAEAAVVATALLSLLETSATSWLTEDESLTGLGHRKFLEETSRLAERIAGV